jgi:glutathione S-transferase
MRRLQPQDMKENQHYRLYGALQSSNTRRVTLLLEHLAIPYELVPLDLRSPTDRGKLLALNPNNKIPVLVHGDFVLWESHAIMQYVCELAPEQTVYPREPRARADIGRWLFWHNAHFAPPLGGLGWENVWKRFVSGEGPDTDQVMRHESVFRSVAKVVDGHLSDRAWLAGETLTIADLSLAATVANAVLYRAPLDPYPHLRAHLDRVRALPAWKTTDPS